MDIPIFPISSCPPMVLGCWTSKVSVSSNEHTGVSSNVSLNFGDFVPIFTCDCTWVDGMEWNGVEWKLASGFSGEVPQVQEVRMEWNRSVALGSGERFRRLSP